MSEYFEVLQQRLRDKDFAGSLLILKSSGGVMGVKLAMDHPEELIESGPAGGVACTAELSRLTDRQHLIHTDMGGTSFDASIVENGKGLLTHSYELEWEVPIVTPMLDIHSVGAGGGSIGWIDEGDSLRVGPQSAGATPGPACYGRGGTEPTVTDANLVLGRLESSLGGKFELDVEAAEKAVAGLATGIGLSLLETAEGMIRISCENMAQAVKMVLVERGRDPRDFTLTSLGGAGAMHAVFVARAMNIPQVIVPKFAGVASAFGAVAMNLRAGPRNLHVCAGEHARFRPRQSPVSRARELGAEPARSRRRGGRRDGAQQNRADALPGPDLRGRNTHPERRHNAADGAHDYRGLSPVAQTGARRELGRFRAGIRLPQRDRHGSDAAARLLE